MTAPPSAPPPPTGPVVRVLVVDDQPLIRRGMGMILGEAPGLEVVGQAADGEEAVQLAQALQPDVVLMDLQMPRMGGVAATREICASCPRTQVVVLTTFDTDELVFDAIRAGAQAYLLKDAEEAEVLETIRVVHRGESRLAPNIARKVMNHFRQLPSAAHEAGAAAHAPAADARGLPRADALTPREERILALIAEGRSNRDIAASVFLAEGTVKNYVSRIMEKLHARTRTELAVRALRK